MNNNELIITTTKINTGSIPLDRDINKIITEINNGNKASHEIARTLNKIKVEENWKSANYDSFSAFCEKFFKISKSQASRLCQVAQRFLNTPKYSNYKITQLIEMLPATDEMLKYIDEKMTAKDIREYVKGALKIEDKTTDPKPEEETPKPEEETPETDSPDPNPEQYVYEPILQNDDFTISKNQLGTFIASCESVNGLKKLAEFLEVNEYNPYSIRISFETKTTTEVIEELTPDPIPEAIESDMVIAESKEETPKESKPKKKIKKTNA